MLIITTLLLGSLEDVEGVKSCSALLGRLLFKMLLEIHSENVRQSKVGLLVVFNSVSRVLCYLSELRRDF